MTDNILTAKQQAFKEAYTDFTNKQTFNNGTQSAKKAGYKGNDNTLAVMANYLLNNHKIINAVKEIEADRQVRNEYNKDYARKLIETQHAKADKDNDVMAAMACIRELDTIHGLRIENINTTDTVKQAEIDQAKAEEANRIASIRLQDFKQVKEG